MLDFRKKLGREIILSDGAAGTMLQAAGLPAGTRPEVWNIEKPEEIVHLHRAYIDAGSDLITTNTFGANELHFPDNVGYTVEQILRAAADNAARAVRESGRDVYIGLDIGPTGKLVGDGGDLDFEASVEIFARIVRAGREFADVVIVETFGNLAETRAAVLAVRENCDLPVIVTNVCGKDGRLFTGASIPAISAVLSGLGADAIGMNCSLGPDEMRKLLPQYLEATDLPIAVSPNAGLPRMDNDGKTVYDVTPEQYVREMIRMAKAGATLLGGCCGTTPEYIRSLRRALGDMKPVERHHVPRTVIASSASIHTIGGGFTVIGERINPTGKPKLKAALRENNIEYLIAEARNQCAAGADVLDVNVGLPDIDEKEMLTTAVRRIQEICSLPLQIDSADSEAMEAALRRYNGKALINSVNGSQTSMDKIFPLAQKYGGVVVGLTLDEGGIPDSAEGRADIAGKIVAEAKKYGIGPENILIDPLTLTLGADPKAAEKTLTAMRLIKERYGVSCSLGVSNVSFGLPDRDKINCDFLAAAMDAGLDAAIMNPMSVNMMAVARGTADTAGAAERLSAGAGGGVTDGCDPNDLTSCVYCGMKARAAELAAEAAEKLLPLEVISRNIIPALERIGKEFETGKVFLPGLLASADAAISALNILTGRMLANGEGTASKGTVVLATVRGDVHDIGKNIVRVMLQSYGFEVTDLGRDVPPERVVEAARQTGAKVVGLSALMTTTLPAMKETIELIRRELPGVSVVVGGAVLTEEYAAGIGADQYAPEAMVTVRFAQKIYSE